MLYCVFKTFLQVAETLDAHFEAGMFAIYAPVGTDKGLPMWLSGKRIHLQRRRREFDP